MGLIIWLIVGGVIGWLASVIMKRDGQQGILLNVVVGIVGGLIGAGALGYDVVRRYQKIREEWRLGSETICLDHTPIGDFVEFEGAKAEAVAKRCGFDLTTSLRKSYLMLYEDYIAEHPDAPRDMIFRDNP